MSEKLSERLERIARGQVWGAGDHETLDEAIELARRFEDAPKVEITACNQIEGAKDFDYGDMVAASQKFDAGQRVRIVPDAGQEVENGCRRAYLRGPARRLG